MFVRLLFFVLFVFPNAGFSSERLALMIGANNGGPGRPALRYAQEDASRFAEVLQKTGQLPPQAITTLMQPRRHELLLQLENIAQDKPRADDRELIIYYSGHADEQGILLGNERVTYDFLRTALKKIPARFKLLIIDACYSGSLTLTKGGSRQSPFLANTAQDAQGIAVMTSSSMDEASQESERLRSSFFTHFLLAGLRGAADNNGDRQITLNEAYHYAYDETLQATSKTQYGVQHPSYDFQLKGRGDIVLTDLRELSSSIEFPSQIEATYYVRSRNSKFFLELRKIRGSAKLISLEKGLYEIVRNVGAEYHQAFFELKDQQRILIDSIDFRAVSTEKVVTRGDTGFPDIYQRQDFRLSLWPTTDNKEGGREVESILHISPLIGSVDRLKGIGVGLLGHVSHDVHGLVLSLGFNYNLRRVVGLQLAPGMNSTEELAGGQLGLYNYAYQLESGAQVGMVNISGLSRGNQIGLFNFAKSSNGIQLGLFNYAERSNGISIAPLIVVKDGIIRVDSWIDNLGLLHLSFRSGTPYYYSTVYISSYGHSRIIGIGPGVRLPMTDSALALDYSWAVREGYYRTTSIGPSGTREEGKEEKILYKMRRSRLFYEWTVTPKIFALVGISETLQEFSDDQKSRLKNWKPLALGQQKDSESTRRQLGLLFGLSYSLVEAYL